MVEDTLETLSEKLKIYQKFFSSLAPVPTNILNTLTPSSTPSTEGSLTPAPTLSRIIYKPNKRYIKVEEILELTNLKKNEYNNLLSEVRFVMANLHVNFSVPYKEQDVNLVSKIIKRFTKRNPNAPIGEGSWVVKELIKKHFQHRREYVKKKERRNENGREDKNEGENEVENENENENEVENEVEDENENQYYQQQLSRIQNNDNVNTINVDKQTSESPLRPFRLILPEKKSASRFRKQYLDNESNEQEKAESKCKLNKKENRSPENPKEKRKKIQGENIENPTKRRKRKIINYKE